MALPKYDKKTTNAPTTEKHQIRFVFSQPLVVCVIFSIIISPIFIFELLLTTIMIFKISFSLVTEYRT